MPITTTTPLVTSIPPVAGKKRNFFFINIHIHYSIVNGFKTKDGFFCDFETSFCGWSQGESGSTVNWIRKNGNTRPGPSYDQ